MPPPEPSKALSKFTADLKQKRHIPSYYWQHQARSPDVRAWISLQAPELWPLCLWYLLPTPVFDSPSVLSWCLLQRPQWLLLGLTLILYGPILSYVKTFFLNKNTFTAVKAWASGCSSSDANTLIWHLRGGVSFVFVFLRKNLLAPDASDSVRRLSSWCSCFILSGAGMVACAVVHRGYFQAKAESINHEATSKTPKKGRKTVSACVYTWE